MSSYLITTSQETKKGQVKITAKGIRLVDALKDVPSLYSMERVITFEMMAQCTIDPIKDAFESLPIEVLRKIIKGNYIQSYPKTICPSVSIQCPAAVRI